MNEPMLRIESLTLERGGVAVLDDVSLTLPAGRTLALIGESGAGKSTLAFAAMGLLRAPEVALAGRLMVGDTDVVTAREPALRALRGARVGMVFQDAAAALNPCFTVLGHLGEPLRRHRGLKAAACRQRAVELLGSVGIGDPAARLKAFPHELSGGMQQRVMIAIALACEPQLLIADEPTSALDVVVQRQVMETLRRVQEELGPAVILVGHDMGLMAQFVHRLGVMYAGFLVEVSPVRDVFSEPLHPYTRLLIASLPSLEAKSSLQGIPGLPPSLLNRGPGCPFYARCPSAMAVCQSTNPLLQEVRPNRWVACHLYTEVDRAPVLAADPDATNGSRSR